MVKTHEVQTAQQAELRAKLWSMADELRGNMDASEFKNYILGLIFFKFLSDKLENYGDNLYARDNKTFAEVWTEIKEAGNVEKEKKIRKHFTKVHGFFMEPEFFFSNLAKDCENNNFDIQKLKDGVAHIIQSTKAMDSENDFKDLFKDMDLNSHRLGENPGNLISKVITQVNDISYGISSSEIDVLGDAYEYLIGKFASGAGKKAGEFYTPQQVSKLVAKLATMGKKDEVKSAYDPTMGSGSLLLRVGDYAKVGNYYGQEKIQTTYNLARMNMLMHGVNYKRFELKQGDTLESDQFVGKQFDIVVANPPYSAKWDTEGKLDDERFKRYGKTAPKSKADFAFVQHMLHHLSNDGTMAVVLPHGVLFRGAAEEKIRRYMIETENVLDAVIGLPANLFYGTSIPTTILVFKKDRENKDIFFIDASSEFEKGKNQNNLTDENIEKIFETYAKREDVDKYAHKAEYAEIVENDFNLNIPRYVDTFEEEEPIDIVALSKEIKEIDARIAENERAILSMLEDLVVTDDTRDIIEATKEVFRHE